MTTPTRLTFLNKHGALEDIWLKGTIKETIKTKSKDYRSNIKSGLGYTIGQHQYKTLRKQGRQSIKINSGYYPEAYNEAFEQLMVSEKVWMEYKGDTLPISIKTSNMDIKTHLVDKLINYKFDIEMAFDKINQIS